MARSQIKTAPLPTLKGHCDATKIDPKGDAGTPAKPKMVAADLIKLLTDRLYQETLSTQSVLKCVRDLIIEGLDGGEAGGAEVAEVVRIAIERLNDICDDLESGITAKATDEERKELDGVQS